MTLPEFIFEDEVRTKWRLSRATLFRARRNGLQFRRIGWRLAYVAADLEEWFAKPRGIKAANVEREGRTNG